MLKQALIHPAARAAEGRARHFKERTARGRSLSISCSTSGNICDPRGHPEINSALGCWRIVARNKVEGRQVAVALGRNDSSRINESFFRITELERFDLQPL